MSQRICMPVLMSAAEIMSTIHYRETVAARIALRLSRPVPAQPFSGHATPPLFGELCSLSAGTGYTQTIPLGAREVHEP